jgi:archaellin
MDKPKYALYTGTEDAEEREILRNIYNGSWKNVPKSISDVLVPKSDTNNMGQHIKVIMITAAGSEGINLFNTRFVHLIEPYWNNVRLEQVVGRARRICSHQSLPLEKQTVSVFLYLSVLTKEQYTSSKELMHYDVSKINDKRYMSSDETLYEIACIKELLNTKILHAVKEASIDCATHVSSSSKENLTCLSFGELATNPNAFSYLPDIKNDQSDEVSKQNVEMIALNDFKKMARRVDGVQFVKQISTGKKYTVESFERAQRTNNLRDLILFTD